MARATLRFSGFGGQGIILAGVIVAKAAVEQDGIYAALTQSYGAESRGGACMANIVLSQERIDYPEPEELDILVVMSQSALDQHIGGLLPDGILIVDSDMVPEVPQGLTGPVYRIPATQTATQQLGGQVAANMVMLGATARLTSTVSIHGLIAAMENTVPSHMAEPNRHAIQAGVELAEELVS
jgi:2-oxoglutarate ferredoxin oxidoreductase subunit gamma